MTATNAPNAPIAMDTVLTFIGTLDANGLDTVFSAIVRRAGKIARDAGGYAAGRYFADPSEIVRLATYDNATIVDPIGNDKKAIATAEKATIALHKAADAINKALDLGVRIGSIVGEANRETSAAARTVSGSREIVKIVERATRRA
jgi:hypothetical protein